MPKIEDVKKNRKNENKKYNSEKNNNNSEKVTLSNRIQLHHQTKMS